MPTRHYPINVALAGANCLIVGGGRVACRKAEALVDCGAHVAIVSPRFAPELARLHGVELVQRPFRDSDVEGQTLVFAATADREVNRLVARAARHHGVWVNVVDTPAECDFIVPATVHRGHLTVSISTNGAAPALARSLRIQLEELFPDAYARYVALLAQLRDRVIAEVADPARRRAILRRLAEPATWETFQAEGPEAMGALAQALIAEAQ